jgi:hypothetical protein
MAKASFTSVGSKPTHEGLPSVVPPCVAHGLTPQLSHRGRRLRRLPWKAVRTAPVI